MAITPSRVALTNDYAFVADGANGLCAINVSDPPNPTGEMHLNECGLMIQNTWENLPQH
ncbi:MAG: hypothetical protein HYY30_08435 [Chloroflexi bacterium]|nr:hypothetical protein [Chloroflexota bacterium]